MRIWSIHPQYLDAKGLVALWRETLLAQHVLEGKTKGYKNHPQLNRFKELHNPAAAINQYLAAVLVESKSRGYKFDESKINWNFSAVQMNVTQGQMAYEREHLLMKLESRDPSKFAAHSGLQEYQPHPMFSVVDGGIEDWEIT